MGQSEFITNSAIFRALVRSAPFQYARHKVRIRGWMAELLMKSEITKREAWQPRTLLRQGRCKAPLTAHGEPVEP